MRWRLIPREESFFADFVKMANEIQLAATLFQEMVEPDEPLWDRAARINDVEHRCDALTHDVLLRLHRTFVTPIDREDIHALADGARRRDGRHRRLRRRSSGSTGSIASARARASWPHILVDQTRQVEKALEALSGQKAYARARRRDRPARERGRPRPRRRIVTAVRRREGSDRR